MGFGEWIYVHENVTSGPSHKWDNLLFHTESTPNPSLEGFDIAPGTSATIGIISKEIHRLAAPYSNCTTVNIEMELLYKQMRRDRKDLPERGQDVLQVQYRIADCRATCMQVWSNWIFHAIRSSTTSILSLMGKKLFFVVHRSYLWLITHHQNWWNQM